MSSDARMLKRLCAAALAWFPEDPPDPVEWCEEHVIMNSSARSKHFRCDITPWIREPLYRAAQGIWTPPQDFYLDMLVEMREGTMLKPVQTGGSAWGECMLMYWAMFARGMLQFNWTDDKKAKDRWESRISDLFENCAPVRAKKDALGMFDARKMEIDFGNVFFRMQGIFEDKNLDSDSVPLQINEEIHTWPPGFLKKAENRARAVWNYKRLNISNAGMKGDQLDQAYRKGTMQQWLVKCPGCNDWHFMRTRFDKKRPELGGLWYDADGCRRGFMEYDYNKLAPTIHYQMPCGFRIHHKDKQTRKALSLSGKYSEPTNKGCELSIRSYTYHAVTVDFSDWVQIVMDKHDALRARKLGDPEPWRRYCCETECEPYDPEDIPIVLDSVKLALEQKKNREGLAEANKGRLFALDRQQGEADKGEFPHWWLVIRDFAMTPKGLKSILVYEGKCETDEGVIAVLDEHQCNRWMGCADSGDDTTHVYRFCLKYGINAIKGGNEELYAHEKGVRRIFSVERPLHAMLSGPPLFPYVQGVDGPEPDDREPLFWLYSKPGVRERLHWLRTNTEWLTPGDASDDYKEHMAAEERTTRSHPRTNQEIVEWVKLKKRNDMFVCECYIAMMVDMVGLIGEVK